MCEKKSCRMGELQNLFIGNNNLNMSMFFPVLKIFLQNYNLSENEVQLTVSSKAPSSFPNCHWAI